ncbi:IS4 family transposase [Pseudomonas chlororaphis]|uniref:IS4 family transposase n=1 Tax=Pseudomonas chlororaphis TaxID=587753 RepID=A0AAP9VZW9_9PSED|nr:IS4 family transposase [Pseudomonas chlororaphis]AUG44109.1 IS4 family transposase [Pseudomonas chlororaphis]AUG44222.1 IS4 family transposase [Pseudomonas chlororaphis]QNR50840.1 IS4 family transposase [Pseudomonas chlororaphis]QNR50931.1 IS4 family transposase [Pseudomonas chlororaphis]
MAKLALEQAIAPEWVDQVFEEHRQRQYSRELLFSTIVKLMSLVSLGLKPSLHAAAKQLEDLPVSLAALYDKVSRTEPALLRALVTGCAQRLTPTIKELGGSAMLPDWQVRVVDGSHLASTEKRLGALRHERGAARPGFSVVVYDPDLDQVIDLQPCEDAYASERVCVLPLLADAKTNQVWIADRLYCTLPVMEACEQVKTSFVIRQQAKHPRLIQEGEWQASLPVATGTVREQSIEVRGGHQWRRIELTLHSPNDSGDRSLMFWSNLPESISAPQIADFYRRRWSIEGMFQRLEAILESEIESLGSPRAALLGFTTAVLAYNVLALLKRSVEHAHRETQPEGWEVSIYHLAIQVRAGYEGMQIALPVEYLPIVSMEKLAQRLLELAKNIQPKQVAKSQRGPKVPKPRTWVQGTAVHAHVSTDRVIKAAKTKRP